MKRPVTTGALLGLVLAIGWWGIHHEARQSVARGIARFTASLPPGATFSYTNARPLLWQRGVALRGVVYHEGDISLTLQDLSISGASGYPTLGFQLHGLLAHGVHYTDARRDLSADEVELQGLSMPPVDRAANVVPDIAAVALHEATLHGFSMMGPAPVAHLAIPALRIRDFVSGHLTNVLLDKPVLTLQLPNDPAGRMVVLSWERVSDQGNAIVQTTAALLSGRYARTPRVPGSVDDFVADGGDFRFGTWAVLVGKFEGHERVNEHGIEHTTAAFHQMRLPSLPEGYNDHTGDLAVESTLDNGQGTVSLDRMTLTVPGAGSLALKGQMDRFSLPATAQPADAQPGRLVSLDLTMKDDGLANTIVQHMAHHDGVDPATERQTLLQRAQMMQIADPRFGTAYAWFAQPDGRSLVIGVHPPTPIPLDRSNFHAGQQALMAATTVQIQ